MNFDLKFYWGLFLKRLPVMLALFLICAISAGVSALKLPPTYSTSALLLVEEAQIPDSMIGTAGQSNATQQLQVIEQRLLTRANLLDTARKHNVFENMRAMNPDQIVAGMRARTQVRRTGGRGQAILMTVSFEARFAEIAANVVNEYVTLILQESTDFRMRRAEGTLAFFEQEVARLGEDLDVQSGRIVRFKNAHSEALPSDLNFRQSRLAQLQERQARLERDVSSIEKQRADMVRIFESTGRLDAQDPNSLPPEQRQLQQLEADLQQALAIYSETNPRIVILQNRIQQLKESIAESAAASESEEDGETRPATMLELTLAEMDQRSASLREELTSVNQEVTELNISIQETAGNAISLNALERDFQNIQARYNEAVRNLNTARVNERIEVSAQGERISVIENANVPQEPSGPNRFKLIAMGVAAGGGLAAGFFLLLELLNRAIRRPAELQAKFGIIPLAVVPYMESPRERTLRRAALVSAFLAVLIGVPAALWYIDTQYMPLDILANKVFDRLGLT